MNRRIQSLTPQEQESLHELARVLKERFWESGLSLIELERRTNLDKGLLSRILNGRQRPSENALQLIANCLGLPSDEYLLLEALAGRIPSHTSVGVRYSIARLYGKQALRESRGPGKRPGTRNWRDYTAFRGNEELVRNTLLRFGKQFFPVRRPPIPIAQIAERLLGLTVSVEDLSELGERNGGILLSEQREIVVDEHVSSEGRFRFIIAHECAHWILHTSSISGYEPFICVFQGRSRSHGERLADAFAAELLMPFDFLKPAAESCSSIGLAQLLQLSNDFVVSKRAMGIQLAELSRLGFISVTLNLSSQE